MSVCKKRAQTEAAGAGANNKTLKQKQQEQEQTIQAKQPVCNSISYGEENKTEEKLPNPVYIAR